MRRFLKNTMPADMQKLTQNKEAILNVINANGPSLPVQIARQTNLSLLFASAYLSELYNERKVKMSHMKVGSSPLYYFQGQEHLLENFIQYLNNKEKEAFTLLKNQRILDDEKMEPAIRVALRAIKDFAVPIRVKLGNDSRLFWKHHLISDDEIRNLPQSAVAHKKEQKPEKDDKEKQKTLTEKAKPVVQEKEIVLPEKPNPNIEQLKQNIEEIAQAIEKPKKERKKKVAEESKFAKNIKEYLSSREIEILSPLEEKKNSFIAKVRLDIPFGKQEYYLVSKDKKKISEEDIIIALQKSQEEKMPLLLMAPGEIDKKALDYYKNWRNLIKFEKVKF